MTVNFQKMLSKRRNIIPSQYQNRAIVQQSRIEDKETDVELIRGVIKLPPQTVRLELDNTASPVESEAGRGAARKATIFGIHGHPDLHDTDIRAEDIFVMDDVQYRVMSVNRQVIGQVQAYCEAVG